MSGDVVERLRQQSRDGLMSLPDDFEMVSYAEAADRIEALEGHVDQLVGLLDILKEHWIDYDHVFSISVHEARSTLTNGGENGR